MQNNHDHHIEFVEPMFACPACGERDMDRLDWLDPPDDQRVQCQGCGFFYEPLGVPAMGTERHETFTHEDGLLVRRVVPASGRGKPYEHTCTQRIYDDVAYAIEQMDARSFSGEELRGAIDAPFTQVFVAIAFLKERSCIVPARDRKHKAATDYVYEDALIEWHALHEKPGG